MEEEIGVGDENVKGISQAVLRTGENEEVMR